MPIAAGQKGIVMTDQLQHKINMLPDSPGCYLMKSEGVIIYIGKAKNLKNRVRQYFHAFENHTPKVRAMVSRVDDFDIILCRNVVIYFTEEAKDKLYRRFLEALRPGGVLFVGGTEVILNFRDIGFQHYLPFFYQKPFK